MKFNSQSQPKTQRERVNSVKTPIQLPSDTSQGKCERYERKILTFEKF